MREVDVRDEDVLTSLASLLCLLASALTYERIAVDDFNFLANVGFCCYFIICFCCVCCEAFGHL